MYASDELLGTSRKDRALAFLNYLYFVSVIAVVSAILITAMVMQYAFGEIPCPLCLLQRVALFGICFGVIANFRSGFSYRNTGLTLLFAVLLLLIAARQTLLDIYPRPGHEYIGTAVLGLHMPVWSVIIALAIIGAYALKLAVLGGDEELTDIRIEAFPMLRGVARWLGLTVIALALINTASVAVQCGFAQCHTMGYRLLQ